MQWHRRLAHIHHPGQIQFVTWRLADALPQDVLAALRADSTVNGQAQIETALDRGYGRCLLRDPAVAQLVQESLLHFDPDRYQMHAWCVMPNHVHLLVEPAHSWPLAKLVQSWKRHTAKVIHASTGTAGQVWQRDYFDKYIRDAAHFNNAVSYIHENPVKAGLVAQSAEWEWSSARIWNGEWKE